MRKQRSTMKSAVGGLLLVSALTVIGCQQNSSTRPEANLSAVEAKEPVESGNARESVGNELSEQSRVQTDDHTAQRMASLDDHEGSEDGPAMGHVPRRMGPGHGMRRGMDHGPRAMGGMRADMNTLHAIFASREKIKRTINMLPDGAEATTESDDETITILLHEHVPAMEGRVMENRPLPPMTFHPIFVELIKHADDYTLEYEQTDKGMKVTYHADDPFVVMLVQEHAKLVSRFIKNGMEEIHKLYSLPAMEERSNVPVDPTTEKTNKTTFNRDD